MLLKNTVVLIEIIASKCNNYLVVEKCRLQNTWIIILFRITASLFEIIIEQKI